MDVSNRARKPAGAPKAAGGQFDVERRAAVEGTLSLRDRAALLASGAYAAPTAITPAVDPSTAAARDDWWTTEFAAAEYGHAEGQYAQMPDDYTPSMTLGQSLSGHRRTHRMNYAGSGVSIRMPSATAIKRFAKDNHENTFDVPITADTPLGQVGGWVRVTPGANGQFEVRGLGLPEGQEAYVAEAARAVLEGRRPSRALADVGNLLARRRERAERIGTEIHPVRSTWIDGLGYDEHAGMMVMTTGGRKYGYHVDQATFAQVVTSGSPGREYNQLVKGKAERMSVERCGACGHFYSDASGHQCAVSDKPRSAEGFAQNAAAAERIKSLVGKAPAAVPGAPATPVAPEPTRVTATMVLANKVMSLPSVTRPAVFKAAGQKEAIELLRCLPQTSLERAVAPGAPTTRTVLSAASRFPAEIAFAGQVRGDGEVAVNGVYLFGHGQEALGYIVKRFELGFPGTSRPSTLTKVSVPSRPGELAWLATWG